MAVLRGWLPPSEVHSALEEEPKRFSLVFKGLKNDWSGVAGTSRACRILNLSDWLDQIDSLEPERVRPAITTAMVNEAVVLLLDIVQQTEESTSTRATWAAQLNKQLRAFRWKVTCHIPWRPLHTMLSGLSDLHYAAGFSGPLNSGQEYEQLILLAQRSRRYFPSGSASEIWQLCRPMLFDTNHPDAFQGAIWLTIFMPTRMVQQGGGDWNAWLLEWVACWESIVHCNAWDSMWLTLLARLAKHDTRGVIDWSPVLSRIMARCVWFFQVQVGTATATPPFGRRPPAQYAHLLSCVVSKRLPRVAKLFIWLLERVQTPMPSGGTDDSVLSGLERLVNLLEQYYHPSNNGRWTGSLASFLDHLSRHFSKRVAFEQSPEPGGDLSEDEDLEDDRRGNELANGTTHSQRPELSHATQQKMAGLIVKLASRSQYAKDSEMVSKALGALSRMSNWVPDLVLSLVQNRFQAALEAVSATHQLSIAVETLATCTRPFLLHGLAPPDSETDGTAPSHSLRAVGAEAVAAAMNATLPGIDANDESKSRAVFRFYCMVLVSIPSINDGGLPLYAEEWLDELMSRIFAILTNLDSPEVRSDLSATGQRSIDSDCQSFLLHDTSMFRPMMELLFNRLPGDMRDQLIRRIAKFALGNTLPSVAGETGVLLSIPGNAAPEQARQHILEPLLASLESELPSLMAKAKAAEGLSISKVQEASLKWKLSLLASTIGQMGPHLLPLKQRLASLLDSLLGIPSSKISEAAASMLSVLLNSLVGFYLLRDSASMPCIPWTEGQGGIPVEAWVHLKGQEVPESITHGLKPEWHIATAEEVAFAETLLQRHLLGAAQDLAGICRGEGSARGPEKEVVRGALHRIYQCLSGVQACLPDFSHPGPQLSGDALHYNASSGARVGSADMREKVAEALLIACRHKFSDPEVQHQLFECVDHIISRGSNEAGEHSSANAGYKKDAAFFMESKTSTLLTKLPGKWRSRHPRWMLAQRTHMLMLSRCVTSAGLAHTTTDFPKLPLSKVPPMLKELFVEAAFSLLSSFKTVSTAADAALRRSARRYPCLVLPLLPFLLRATAAMQLPSAQQLRASLEQPDQPRHQVPGLDLDFLAELCEAASQGVALRNPTAMITAAEMSEEQGRAMGAMGLLSSPAFSRITSYCLQPALGFTAAMLASSANRSPLSMTAAARTHALHLLRYQRPLGFNDKQDLEQDRAVQLVVKLLLSTGSASPEKPIQWRYCTMANSMLLILTPVRSAHMAKQLTDHMFHLLLHPQDPQRSVAAFFFIYALHGGPAWDTAEVQEAIAEALRQNLGDHKDWVKGYLELFSNSHPTVPPAPDNTSRGGIMAGMKDRDEAMVTILMSHIKVKFEWPQGRSPPVPLVDGTFSRRNVLLFTVLIKAAPEQMSGSLQTELTAHLSGVPPLEDRPKMLVAIELLVALVSSGILFEGESSAWDAWVKPLLVKAFSQAPLDFGGIWAVSLRYMLYHLSKCSIDGFNEILRIVLRPVSIDDGTATLTKWLKVVANILAELNCLGVTGCREPPGDAELKRAGQAFQAEVLSRLPELMQTSGESARSYVASSSVILLCSLLYTPPIGEAAPGEDRGQALDRKVQDFLAYLVRSMEEGADAVAEAESQTGDVSGDEGDPKDTGGAQNLLATPVIARLGTSLQVLNLAFRGGDGLGPLPLRPTLLRMLEPLLKIQEMAAPELQRLAMEAKSAAAILKYLPVTPDLLPEVVETLKTLSAHTAWPARAAALVFVQYFWFRHLFTLPAEQSAQCQQLVVQLTRDKKYEVQEMAAGTLAGLLKGLSEPAFHSLRCDLLHQAQQLFPKRNRSRAATAVAASSAEKHAVVLGLKAFVLCTPYDVPAWLPEVLMVLTQAASQPAPIKVTVRKALSDFKRTHEEAGLQEMRSLLTDDQWETIQGIASPASYFA